MVCLYRMAYDLHSAFWPKPPSEEVAALNSAKNIDDDFDDDDVSDADERDDDEEISVT